MSHDAETVGEMFMLWKATEKAFLQHLLIRLMEDVPDFNSEKFATGLHLLQEGWPIDRTDKDQEAQGLVSLRFLDRRAPAARAANRPDDGRGRVSHKKTTADPTAATSKTGTTRT
ncbi:hypothetical protein NKH60_19355 [Mesorhizobium sp. M1006]|uniref:hypothetical protein n=1 Tax=Mesorhizobium sp. M1006 TaxID=2957048 RepID=UPI00333C26F8